MNQHKFTPGPWRVVGTNSGLFIAGSVPGYFCEMRDCSSTIHVADNARAIAALPELVAALEGMEQFFAILASDMEGSIPDRIVKVQPYIRAARAALAKVNG